MGSYWFAAAPSRQERTRISLNFGLGRAERLFNERVVPGLGRVWFVRQISWPVSAIALRERLRGTINTKASAISHGLKALGCMLEWGENPDGERILGKRAFGRDADDDIWAFDKLRTTKHYVQNTHRQATSRAIRNEGGLGLASGSRFDAYELSTFRKNSLFVGSLGAGERYANVLTVLLNCELAGVNPYVYLVDVIDKIAADWPADRVTKLLPRAWLAARQAEQQRPGQAGAAAVT